jgi:hypothetical protein
MRGIVAQSEIPGAERDQPDCVACRVARKVIDEFTIGN